MGLLNTLSIECGSGFDFPHLDSSLPQGCSQKLSTLAAGALATSQLLMEVMPGLEGGDLLEVGRRYV